MILEEESDGKSDFLPFVSYKLKQSGWGVNKSYNKNMQVIYPCLAIQENCFCIEVYQDYLPDRYIMN